MELNDIIISQDGERRYRLEEAIAEGAMGEVVKATVLEEDRTVAVKLPKDLNEELRQRFLKEGESVTDINKYVQHPNIVRVFDVGEGFSEKLGEPQLYLVMEYIDGQSLQDIVNKLPGREEVTEEKREECKKLLAYTNVARMIAQAADGLQMAHSNGILHRDIKPANIMLTKDGVVKLTDFGLVRMLDKEESLEERLTGETHMLGTLLYMPPEQIKEVLHTDFRADIYSLAATMYCLLGHYPPFFDLKIQKISDIELMNQIVYSDPYPLKEINKNIPDDLIAIVKKGMEKYPEDRFQTAKEMGDALRAYVEEMMRVQTITRRRFTYTAAGITAFAVLGGIGFGIHSKRAAQAKTEKQFSSVYDPAHEVYAVAQELLTKRTRLREQCYQAEDNELEDKANETLIEIEGIDKQLEKKYQNIVEGFQRALLIDPEQREKVYAPMAESLMFLIKRHERRMNFVVSENLLGQLRALDTEGRYASFVKGDSVLDLDCEPTGAAAVLYKYVNHDGVLVPEKVKDVQFPFKETVSMGSYLLAIDTHHHEDKTYIWTYYPLFAERGSQLNTTVKLLEDENTIEGVTYVLGGEFLFGKNNEPRYLNTYGISDEIENGIYRQFLSVNLPRRRHFPLGWDVDDIGIVVKDNTEGKKYWGKTLGGITQHDVEAFIHSASRGVSRQTGKHIDLRLPTEMQWEKAARGVDGRIYPWGNDPEVVTRLDMAFYEGSPTDKLDESPYGVKDMFGTVMEWTDDSITLDDGRQQVVVKGASFMAGTPSHLIKTYDQIYFEPDRADARIGARYVHIPSI